MEYPNVIADYLFINHLDNWILNVVVTTIDFNKYVSSNLILEYKFTQIDVISGLFQLTAHQAFKCLAWRSTDHCLGLATTYFR